MRRTSGGVLIVKKIVGWVRANPDGTISNSYVKKWWPR